MARKGAYVHMKMWKLLSKRGMLCPQSVVELRFTRSREGAASIEGSSIAPTTAVREQCTGVNVVSLTQHGVAGQGCCPPLERGELRHQED